MTYCLLEASVATGQISYPFQRGWVETGDHIVLRDRVTAEMLADEPVMALIDAAEAARVLESHSVIADVALVSNHRGPFAMKTSQRADEIERATVQLGEAGATAEAVARSTIYHFYGIDVVDWVRSSQDTEVLITDVPESLREPAEGFNEDLVRAWFILTSMALPTHLLVTSRSLLQEDQDGVERVVRLLRDAIRTGNENRRELRRNLAGDLDLDRERLTELFNDQKTRLTRNGRKGWLDLVNRVSRPMNLPAGANPDVVSFGLAQDEQD